ncbi:unnamed protein product [Candidula unifasciata]|uniref:Laminin subunit gamma-1 n=1 Tax=Candidula unifasciata TaxID=100452 RepID=A0A8S3YX97_9EUPU|nr:unnamed protein product [Candidula unifasciata]
MDVLLLFLLAGLPLASGLQREHSVPCYDEQNRPQRCQPPFVNAAFGRIVDATNTCGMNGPQEYCLQTGVTGAKKSCYICDNRDPDRRHPASYLSDFNNLTRWTWWQSETMLEGIQYPTVVNLTLHLKKAFDITYVNLRFYSPRPESFAIYKRTTEDGEWIPYQFYSASCEKTYNLPRRGVITASNENQAICTNEFSDISPLTGGSVAFSTLEGRPSMFKFNESPQLQDWVTATDIRIVLTRMNTFGDEVFGDAQVLKSYFYAISDLAVGARCKCNGHARICREVRGQDLEDHLECVCEHFTTGRDCEKCLPFYNDRPWGRAIDNNANECQACTCNGLSETCEFDENLYRLTGRGGRCTDCRDHTAGVHCELCEVNFYRRENQCLNCGCNHVGSFSLQCDESGQCPCKPGVTGQRCDRCLPNYYDFSDAGCRPCDCVPAGSINNEPRCDSRTGLCACKENVEGRQCDQCKAGYFGLTEADPYGCVSCFCYGHSTVCSSAPGYQAVNITSNFETGKQRWTAFTRSNREVETQYNGVIQNLGVSAESNEAVYFTAPSRYHGDQRFSYNQFLTFDLRIGEETARPSVVDIILEGSGQSLSTHIFAQSNPIPSIDEKSFAFRLHENPQYQWAPRIKATDFIGVLSNVTNLKIRGTYNDKGVGFIDNVNLQTARQGYGGDDVTWVESCSCPEGYIGQFCESCLQGYKRDPPNGGPFSRCVPCTCNGHSDSCDVNTGRCICSHNTEGDFCERCARGYYGDATQGTPGDCRPCPCPNGGPCIQLPNEDVVCTECQVGHGGNLCELCLDGYFGDPSGQFTGQPSSCMPCTCNGNIDPNAVGNCNSTTGECLKCIRNTGGFFCDQCLPNFYNDSAGVCTACSCFHSGTVSQPGTSECDQRTGQCLCLPNVIGRQCVMCQQGYWNIASGEGCSPCECSEVGSLNYTCEEASGRCSCKPGVSGRRCDECERYHYGFSPSGCTACNCDPIGSTDLQCDPYGYCPCKENVDGRSCDRYCPQCYNLVQRQVNTHRAKLRELILLIEKTTDNPSLFNDSEFISYLQKVNTSVNVLLRDARATSTGDGTVGAQINELRRSLSEVLVKLGEIAQNIATASKATRDSQDDIAAAEKAIDNADAALRMAENYIDKEGRTALKQALDALSNFGQNSQQMTEIARRATLEAKRQKEEAQNIENVSKIALETSREAYRLANESLNMPFKTQQDIERLRREYDDASLLFQNTKTVANSTLARAVSAKDEAFSLLVLAQEQLPSIDVDMLKQEAEKIKTEANDIKTRARKLIDENQELLAKVKNQSQAADRLLEEGDTLNLDVADLLAEVDYARSEARMAVEKAEKTLKEANDTLTILEEFDKLVNLKDEALKSLQEIPAIQKAIENAQDMTQEARDALADVIADARRALEIARDAEAKALQASQEAGEIRSKAGTTKDKASQLRQDTEELSDDVRKAETSLTGYENQANQDEELAKNALLEAAAAKQKAQDAFDQINEAYRLVSSIRNELGDLGSVDMQQLRALEKQLEEVEKQLAASDIDKKMTELQRKNTLIESQADRFDQDLSELQAAVENIGDIKNSLPVGCYKTIPIEKPAR